MAYSKCEIRADVGDRLRDCRTENIHTRNTLVRGLRLAMLRYGYGIPYFSILSTVHCDMSCDEPVTLFGPMREL